MNDVTRSRSFPSRQRLAACLAAIVGLNVPFHGIASSKPAGAITTPDSSTGQQRFDKSLARHEAPSGEVIVTNCNDSGAGSLRDTIAAAADDATIDLSSLTCSTITLTSGAIAVNQYSLVLVGPGAAALTIDGNGNGRIIDHSGYGFLDIHGLALAHGSSTGNGGCIRSSGGVSLSLSRVSACQAHASGEARGGAIYAYAAFVDGSLVTDGLAESDTAYARGGGVFATRLEVSYSTIRNSEALSLASHGFGGGVYATLDLDMSHSTVSGNVASIAGGVGVHSAGLGYAHIVDSTVSGNVATVFMGGVFTDSPLRLYNSTIAFNCAASTVVNPNYTAGVGLHFRATAPNLESSIIANNTICGGFGADAPEDVPYDISGNIFNGTISGAHNLIVTAAVTIPADTLRTDPLLGPLQDNGGPTPTHALLAGSPAIDAGDDDVAQVASDQRGTGFPRVVGANADIGAYEFNPDDVIFQNGFD